MSEKKGIQPTERMVGVTVGSINITIVAPRGVDAKEAADAFKQMLRADALAIGVDLSHDLDHPPYALWAAQGLINETEGGVTAWVPPSEWTP